MKLVSKISFNKISVKRNLTSRSKVIKNLKRIARVLKEVVRGTLFKQMSTMGGEFV